MRARLRLLCSAVLGLGAFLVPVPASGRWTVAFDILVKQLQANVPSLVSSWCLLLVAVGAGASLLAHRREGPYWDLFRAGPVLTTARLLGLGIALLVLTGLGPEWLIGPAVGGFLWSKLVTAVGILVPLGAVALNIVAGYGLLELVGTWMRPLMRPLFRLPGRAALDDGDGRDDLLMSTAFGAPYLVSADRLGSTGSTRPIADIGRAFRGGSEQDGNGLTWGTGGGGSMSSSGRVSMPP